MQQQRRKPPTTTFYLDDVSRAQVKALAKSLGLSMSSYVRMLLRKEYKELEKQRQ
jgi:antitoxin component of RelBE/YafQ-DinJ toxin-antitoxin module